LLTFFGRAKIVSSCRAAPGDLRNSKGPGSTQILTLWVADVVGLLLLCRYITRPAIANERLSVNRAGQVVLKLKTPYRNGTTHLMMSPLEFMASSRPEHIWVRKGSALKNLARKSPTWVYVIGGAGSQNGNSGLDLSFQ
jgi:hypothetical protein